MLSANWSWQNLSQFRLLIRLSCRLPIRVSLLWHRPFSGRKWIFCFFSWLTSASPQLSPSSLAPNATAIHFVQHCICVYSRVAYKLCSSFFLKAFWVLDAYTDEWTVAHSNVCAFDYSHSYCQKCDGNSTCIVANGIIGIWHYYYCIMIGLLNCTHD